MSDTVSTTRIAAVLHAGHAHRDRPALFGHRLRGVLHQVGQDALDRLSRHIYRHLGSGAEGHLHRSPRYAAQQPAAAPYHGRQNRHLLGICLSAARVLHQPRNHRVAPLAQHPKLDSIVAELFVQYSRRRQQLRVQTQRTEQVSRIVRQSCALRHSQRARLVPVLRHQIIFCR
jgi:hypothetical protein